MLIGNLLFQLVKTYTVTISGVRCRYYWKLRGCLARVVALYCPSWCIQDLDRGLQLRNLETSSLRGLFDGIYLYNCLIILRLGG